jgi:predicted Zn-dependent protease
MFDEEDEDDFEGTLREDLERFEAHLRGDSLGFMDSDRLEMIIDHYLINSQYQKARVCAEYALARFPFLPLFQLRKAQAISAMGQLKEALHVLAQPPEIDWTTPSAPSEAANQPEEPEQAAAATSAAAAMPAARESPW